MTATAPCGLTPDQARARLREGNRRFLAGEVAPSLTDPASRRFVDAAQAPLRRAARLRRQPRRP